MAKNPDSAISKCSGLLQQLISKKLESPDSCDTILQQYKAFITEVQKYHKDEFVAYSSEQGLDSSLYGCIGEKPEYSKLWEAFKMLLILSHGQSCVERGFSDNKDILSNNMQDETLISYRMAYDGIKNQDGPMEDSVTKELLGSSLHLFLHSAVQVYEFHIFIISSSSFPGILRTNLMTSSQLAC